MTTYRRGDVVACYFPHSDGKTLKPRPALVVEADDDIALVVEADDIETGLPQKILALISSKVDKRKGETRVVVLKNSSLGKEMGLRTDSVIVTDNLRTVEHGLIYKKIGYCSDMEPINVALKKSLGL